MKYFIGITVEMYDGKEWLHKSVIEAETEVQAEIKLSYIAHEDYVDGDSVVHKTYIQQEIPENHAQILRKYW